MLDADRDETEVRAALRVEPDGWWGGDLIGPADWFGISASVEPFFELRLPDGRSGAAFVSELDRVRTRPAGHNRRGRGGAVRLRVFDLLSSPEVEVRTTSLKGPDRGPSLQD